MKVLIACEFSGIVRDAFIKRGHSATSCDFLLSERPGPHIRGDVLSILCDGWDMMIAHPTCQYLCSSGLHWNGRIEGRSEKTEAALDFIRILMKAPIKKICIENPVGRISTAIRKPEQIIQPWQFGEDASKKTCFWLKGLPTLKATNILPGGAIKRRGNQTPTGQNKLSPSPDRWKDRSRTYQGVADAMADQWG